MRAYDCWLVEAVVDSADVLRFYKRGPLFSDPALAKIHVGMWRVKFAGVNCWGCMFGEMCDPPSRGLSVV